MATATIEKAIKQAESRRKEKSELLYVADIADRIGRSAAQVNYMIASGKLPGTALIAGRRCMRESDLEAWIDSHFE